MCKCVKKYSLARSDLNRLQLLKESDDTMSNHLGDDGVVGRCELSL